MRFRAVVLMAGMGLGRLAGAQEAPPPEEAAPPPEQGVGGAGTVPVPAVPGSPGSMLAPGLSQSEDITQSGASISAPDPEALPLPAMPSGPAPAAPGGPEPGAGPLALLDGTVVDVRDRQLSVQLDNGAVVSVLATASTRVDGQRPRSAEHLELLLERKRADAEPVRIRFQVEGRTNIAVSID